METSLSRIVLKAKICGLMQSAHKSRELIRATSGAKRNGHWKMKRLIGAQCRLHILAYAYLRGFYYARVERNTDRSQNPIDTPELLKIIQEHSTALVSYEDCTEWLKGKEAKHQWVFPQMVRVVPASVPVKPTVVLPKEGLLERVLVYAMGRQ